jgi:Domain of Unknown Function (DUF326)
MLFKGSKKLFFWIVNTLLPADHSWHGFPYKYCLEELNINGMKKDILGDCIQACQDCVIVCTRCAAACTEKSDVENLSRCIQLNLECAAMCNAAVQLMSLNGTSSDSLCMLCADICRRCAEECGKHDDMNHCRESAERCRVCSILCSQMSMEVNMQ